MKVAFLRRTSAWLGLLTFLCLATEAANWPAWRGPLGTGISEERNLPIHWSTNQNVKWRVPLPEPGDSTPVIWGERIFVTQAVGERRMVLCFNRADGKKLWEAGITTKVKEPTHPTNPYCSASPVTDGQRVIVSFGSDGLYCYDFDGKELWRRTDLGRQTHIWGNGSSPVIYRDFCFLNFGPGENTYLLAVDKNSGKTVWKEEENTGYKHPVEGTPADAGKTYIGSWTTPTLMPVEGRDQLLMIWPNRLAVYDSPSGKEIWSCAGLNPLCYTSPIYEDGIVVAMGGFNGTSIAVRAGGTGDVTEARRLWRYPKTKQRIGSGVVHDGYIYIHNDPGVAECFELKTGKLIWEERLKGKGPSGSNWSSVMLADGNCYTITQGGDCFVFKASPKFELVAVNPLVEPSNSSVAPSDGELFLRTQKSLWCISGGK
ncbi:MAG TPA: PQQ-binding-like beta-propeller repeat protein [Verrucomicrobiae bacterium]|jgi:outer membrane protein assembly factor BamB|nr:PQQ-binding-like beta-propeller repeat protein [Verrucomicrobiae bacterium]